MTDTTSLRTLLRNLSFKFRSGNGVPVDVAWLKRKEFDELSDASEHLYNTNQVNIDLLGAVVDEKNRYVRAIIGEAKAAGCWPYHEDAEIEGPDLLMVLSIMRDKANRVGGFQDS